MERNLKKKKEQNKREQKSERVTFQIKWQLELPLQTTKIGERRRVYKLAPRFGLEVIEIVPILCSTSAGRELNLALMFLSIIFVN
jgi:hypothetical protein